MVISNLKIGTSYFFTPLEEFAKENIRYLWAGGHTLWAYIGLWYLVISLIDHSTMSDADLKGYFQGVWIFILPLFLCFLALGLIAR